MIKLGFVIAGANGYMGGPALETLLKLRQFYDAELTSEKRPSNGGTKLELVMLADPDFFNAADLNVLPPSRKKIRPFLHTLPAILEHNAQLAKLELDENDVDQLRPFPDRVIFYDASPTQYHELNCVALLQKFPIHRHYFGEKPIFLDPAGLEDFEKAISAQDIRPNLYCDFIETANPAVRALKDEIDSRELKIKSMVFWRTGISGIKHAFGHEQHGVQGGAILDKCPHDIAISTMLLEPENIESPSREDCVGTVLLPVADFAERWTSDTPYGRGFLTYDNHWVGRDELGFDFRKSRHLAPADGLSQVIVNWRLKSGQTVRSEYISGWLGLPNSEDQKDWHPAEWQVMQRLQSLGYIRRDWVGETQFRPAKKLEGSSGCHETQARVCFVEASNAAGEETLFVANLYTTSSEHEGATHNLPRWVDEFPRADVSKRRRIYAGDPVEYHKQKADDRHHIFDQVVRAASGISEARYVGPLATILVHKALLYSRDSAFARASSVYTAGGAEHRFAARMAQNAMMRSL